MNPVLVCTFWSDTDRNEIKCHHYDRWRNEMINYLKLKIEISLRLLFFVLDRCVYLWEIKIRCNVFKILLFSILTENKWMMEETAGFCLKNLLFSTKTIFDVHIPLKKSCILFTFLFKLSSKAIFIGKCAVVYF